jgi:valyl-tRNA synthetase
MLSEWPKGSLPESPEADAEINWLIALITAVRSVKTEMNVPGGAKVNLVVVGAGADTGTRIESHLAAITRIGRVERVDYGSEVPPDSAQIVLGDAIFAMPLAGVIDLAAERARLAKESQKLDDEIDRFDRKLGNAQFVEKAPEDVIEEQRQRRADAVERRQRLKEAADRLH